MKKIIFSNYFHESEMRPRTLFKHWKEILRGELSLRFADKNDFVDINCPGCGSKEFNPAFMKFGFEYQRCNVCDSLFVSPRPTALALKRFYQDSQATKFWRDKILKASMDARRRYQVSPLYTWFLDLVKDYQPRAKFAIDYKPKYFSLFLYDKDFYRQLEKIIFVEPLALEQNFSAKNIKITSDLKELENKADVFTAFEVLEREFDPAYFIKQVSRICRKGGLFFLTTNTISGFEYQILGRNSPRLVPPDRLNLLSTEVIHKFLVKEGFEILDLSTPGKLDVELVVNTFKENPNIEMPEFLRYMFKCRDGDTWESLQDFLQLSRLSSFLRVAAIKK